MCPFCCRHPPAGKGCGCPCVTAPVSPKVISQCSTTIPPSEKGNTMISSIQGFLFVGLHGNRRVFRVTGLVAWLSDVYTLYFHPTVQEENNHKEQLTDMLRRTGIGTLMATFLQLVVSYFQRQIAKVIREIPWIEPAAYLTGNGTRQCHGIPVLFSFH